MSHSVTEIKVGLDFGTQIQSVGRLAKRDSIIYFEYDNDFVDKGIEISPLRLPLKRGLQELPARPFEGLAGVFSDSLPDGWGRLLFDRMMRANGILPSEISPLDRLAYVGFNGMGALVYEPDNSPKDNLDFIDLDQLASQTEQVLEGRSEEVISELLALNGSSAGARPKALIGVDQKREKISYGTNNLVDGFEHWLVKFPNSQDGHDAGAIEYVYALMAKKAGILMPEVHLFPSEKGSGYFAVKRFDRDGNKRLHMHTVAGLTHSNFRFPSLDYEDLLNLTGALTKDIREVEKMYRQAVFNVLAHNQDDHAKNFSFLMNENGEWKLSPAYDLTFSSGAGGEQSTMVLGEGKNPTLTHLRKLGLVAGLPKEAVEETIGLTKEALSLWDALSKEYNVDSLNRKLIAKALNK
ncbi:MAG TPA: type II toxin-antitoxin system HipA family toxin [Moheibacter sp.]|nr:type II toxin-antitoxin system HipA family toxin [Moheibacter sp.]